MIPKEGEVFERINPYNGKKERFTATGTRREIKEVLFDFFIAENGDTVFFYPSEVETEMIKI